MGNINSNNNIKIIMIKTTIITFKIWQLNNRINNTLRNNNLFNFYLKVKIEVNGLIVLK